MLLKVENFVKKNYKHLIFSVLVLISLFLTFFYFKFAGLRIKESLIDFVTTMIYYFCKLFQSDYNGVTITEFSSVPFEMPFGLPSTWLEFKEVLRNYCDVFFKEEVIFGYLYLLGDILLVISNLMMIFVMPITLFIIVKVFKKPKVNNDYNEHTKYLALFISFELRFLFPFRLWIKNLFDFFKNNKYYWRLLLIIWMWNFNIFAILIELFSFIYYLIASADYINIYVQVLKLLMDLSVMIDFIPGIIWFCLILKIIDLIRKGIGFKKLEHNEMKNRGFINERPIITFYYGSMGTGKTKTGTDNAISTEIMFRDKALDLMLECDLMFPRFPWINFELELRKVIDNHEVYHLESARRWVNKLKKKFNDEKNRSNIFDYDYENYGMYYDDNTKRTYIWKCLKNYAQLYFIYTIQSSLILSNYSIRVDGVLESEGNFPLWDNDIFRRTTEHNEKNSRFSHILDYDMLRLGKKVLDSKYSDSFEFGIVVSSEIGKERKNNLELQTVKLIDLAANQKNDLFNHRLKFIRHSSTIMNYCFCKIIVDDQRPESWGADARDLCELIYIDNVDKNKLTMPLFAFGELIHGLMFKKFKDNYYEDRFNHGNVSLKSYLYHILGAKIHKYYKDIYAQFGYDKLNLEVESGRLDDKFAVKKKYYISYKKINHRYSTDCYSDLFAAKAFRSKYGLDDIPEYYGITAKVKEMEAQGSFMFMEMSKYLQVDGYDVSLDD